jgi:hypothetical protein
MGVSIMKSNTKKSTKILGVILVVAMIGSPLAYFAKPDSKPASAATKVTEELPKQALPERSVTEVKGNVTKEDIKVEGNKVIGNIKVSDKVTSREAESLIQQYSVDLAKKYVDKDINIEIISGSEQLAKSSTYINTKAINGAPKYSVKIEKGLTLADSYVAVTLVGVESKNYNIVVLNDVLKYVPTKNFFHGIVTTVNEKEILKNIKITIKK